MIVLMTSAGVVRPAAMLPARKPDACVCVRACVCVYVCWHTRVQAYEDAACVVTAISDKSISEMRDVHAQIYVYKGLHDANIFVNVLDIGEYHSGHE